MGYRTAPSHSNTKIVSAPLIARRAIVAALVTVCAAVVVVLAEGAWGWILGAPFLLFAGLLVRAGAGVGSRITLYVDATQRRVLVRTDRWLRTPLEHELDLSEAQSVMVDTQRSDHWLGHLPFGPLLEGQILVRDRGGEVRSLSEPRFNLRSQVELAARLATLLGLEREPVAGLDYPLAQTTKSEFPNARVSVLFGSSIVMVSLLGWSAQLFITRDQGELELRCTSRCRWDGMDCLPGGMIGGSYDPGDYTIEVDAPSEPGGARVVTIPIRTGHRTTFECLPDAAEPIPMPE